jgi:hypothetical protein
MAYTKSIEEGYGFMAVKSVTLVLILPDQTIASGNQFIYGEQCDRLSSTR